MHTRTEIGLHFSQLGCIGLLKEIMYVEWEGGTNRVEIGL